MSKTLVLAGVTDQILAHEYAQPGHQWLLKCDKDGRVVTCFINRYQTRKQKQFGYSSSETHTEMLPGHWIS